MLERAQNVVGGIPDLIMRDGLLFDGKKNALGRDEYLERLAFYEKYRSDSAPLFFDPIPTTAPTHRVLGTRPFDVEGPADSAHGEQVLLTYPSRYDVKQPALEIVAPVTYRPKMNVDDIGVVYHQGDRLTGATYVRDWVERWGIKNVTPIPGGHWATFDHKARGKAWYGWLKRYGFVGKAEQKT